MDTAREFLENITAADQGDRVSRLRFAPHKPHAEPSFYEYSVLRGVRVESVRCGSTLYCSFTVPARLIDRNGKLSAGAIASLVDEIGAAAIHKCGKPMDVSVDMSIAYISDAKMNDELEITSRCLGQRGSYHSTGVLIRNRTTGEIVAQGRHSLFSLPATASKL
ncbi:acyl-coenzyme A thioesterase 13-like [Salvia divinorum]|uniref:Acyl-coenzyme A thioesterase 13 n=1 Tax=Salvia divinorum TaxID=28513 RepID=A0ABD1GLQ5_SALDI